MTGRKNWLFSVTPNGATASAIYYSIIISSIENGLNPFEYLSWVFTNTSNIGRSGYGSDISELLPYSPNLPKHLYVPESQKHQPEKHAWEEDE